MTPRVPLTENMDASPATGRNPRAGTTKILDNDRVQDDLREHLASEFGPECRDRYWKIFEELRNELGYADYLGALQR